jgi:hypothetical protein
MFNSYRNSEPLLYSIDAAAVMVRRAPLDEGYNRPMYASLLPTEQYYYHMFVKVHTNIDDNTVENNKAWAENIAEKMTEFARANFEYTVDFEYRANLTEDPLPCPNKYALNRDVIRILDWSYPVDIYSRQIQADSLAEDYFGVDAAAGREAILAFDQSPMT